jgi:proteasome lid subunit RPN8/RPN11
MPPTWRALLDHHRRRADSARIRAGVDVSRTGGRRHHPGTGQPVGLAGALRLRAGIRCQLESWALARYPREACGLLIGVQREDGRWVERATEARNLDHERPRDRYELDPQDFLAADELARRAGMELVGVWHTHPGHPARPSQTDHAAAWPGWSYVIVSVSRAGVEEVRSWRLNGDGDFEEEVIYS